MKAPLALKRLVIYSSLVLTLQTALGQQPSVKGFMEQLKGKEEASKGFAKMIKEFKNYAETSSKQE
jgi:hypothetical protein